MNMFGYFKEEKIIDYLLVIKWVESDFGVRKSMSIIFMGDGTKY